MNIVLTGSLGHIGKSLTQHLYKEAMPLSETGEQGKLRSTTRYVFQE